jgi:ABC-type lipoprotein release transport system permease subunit
VTALLLVGQALARQLYGESSDYPTLRALGMTRRQLLAVGMIRSALVGAGGAVVAAVIAIATSPFMPIGPARLAEPNPGFRVDAGIIVLGVAGIVGALMLVIAVPVLLHARARPSTGSVDPAGGGRSSRLGWLLSRVGAPTSMTAGVRMAVDPGRGPTSAPVRSATLGTILAVAALAATITFGSSLDRMIGTPRLYGQTWDLNVDAGFGMIPADATIARLEASPDVESFSAGHKGELVVEGSPVAAIGVDVLRGTVVPTMLEGRGPRVENEIALGTGTLRRLGRKVGDEVEVAAGDAPARMRIVGRAVFPQFGLGSFAPTGLGEGALTTAASIPPPSDEPGYNFFLVRLRDDASPGAVERVRESISKDVPECQAGFCYITRTQQPGDVVNYARVRATPLVLAGMLSLLAIAAVGHALVTSVRRRARELAILKTFGFVRRQVAATVAWQATTMIVISLAVGIPAGVTAGRAVWTGFADRLGVPPEPVVPLLALSAGTAVALLLANAAAAFPGRQAARVSPAVVLRDE